MTRTIEERYSAYARFDIRNDLDVEEEEEQEELSWWDYEEDFWMQEHYYGDREV